MDEKKMLVAMSGGVDSSVAAYLTRQAGHCCAGAIARMCDETLTDGDFGQNISDARAVAQRLDMDFHIIEAVDAFKQAVVNHFICAYEGGLTPNPCVQCNRHIKFSFLLDKALELGYDTVVTGHYAKIRHNDDTGRYLLYKAADSAKDQSYFLACLNQYQLAHARFPLGEFTKEQIRKIAEEQGFLTAKKKDSQDICFIPDGDYMAFIRRYTGRDFDGGDFLDLQGNVVGKHTGAMGYTLGQRKGLGLAMGAPVYVCAKDMAANTVTVGPENVLYTSTLLAGDANWFPFPILNKPMRVEAKARSRHTPQAATVYPAENGFRVVFDAPQRAVTPGQTVVLYQGDMVVGSGTITETY